LATLQRLGYDFGGARLQALRLRSDDAVAHYNLGSAWLRTPGRLNDAVTQFKEALRLRPDFAEAHFNLAVALLNLHGHIYQAEEQLEVVLRLQPENETARQILARIRESQP